MALVTHYDNLKVARNAPPNVIRAAYRTLAQEYHPDRYADTAKAERIMKIVNVAYAALSDPAARQEHDEWIAREEAHEAEQVAREARIARMREAERHAEEGRAAAHRAYQLEKAKTQGDTHTETSSPQVAQVESDTSSVAHLDPISPMTRFWLSCLLISCALFALLGLFDLKIHIFKWRSVFIAIAPIIPGFYVYIALFRPKWIDDDTYRESREHLSVGRGKYFFYFLGVCLPMFLLYCLINLVVPLD